MITVAIMSIIWFVQWIFYLQKVRLHPGGMEEQQQQQQREQHELAQISKKVAFSLYPLFTIIE